MPAQGLSFAQNLSLIGLSCDQKGYGLETWLLLVVHGHPPTTPK